MHSEIGSSPVVWAPHGEKLDSLRRLHKLEWISFCHSMGTTLPTAQFKAKTESRQGTLCDFYTNQHKSHIDNVPIQPFFLLHNVRRLRRTHPQSDRWCIYIVREPLQPRSQAIEKEDHGTRLDYRLYPVYMVTCLKLQ